MLLALTMFFACGEKEETQDTSAVDETAEEMLEDTSTELEESENEDTAMEETETGR